MRMYLEWENNSRKLQIISGKFQSSGKFQNNTINDVKQISMSHVITKEIKFEGIWGKLEAKECFKRQSFTKYSRLTLNFMWNNAILEKFNFYFWRGFPSTNKIFNLAGGLGTGLSLYGVRYFPDIF